MSDPAEPDASRSPSRETHASVLSGMRLSKDGECRNKSRTRFFQTYQPLLFVFFRRKGVGEHDAEDLASDLLAKLLGTMDTFQYDASRSFRNYLRTAARNAVKEFWESHAKRRTAAGVDLDQHCAREELQERLEGQFDLDLLEEAERRVRGEVSDRDWEIYVELTKRPTPPEDLASRLGIARNTVDNAKHRVLKQIKALVEKLHQQGPQEL